MSGNPQCYKTGVASTLNTTVNENMAIYNALLLACFCDSCSLSIVERRPFHSILVRAVLCKMQHSIRFLGQGQNRMGPPTFIGARPLWLGIVNIGLCYTLYIHTPYVIESDITHSVYRYQLISVYKVIVTAIRHQFTLTTDMGDSLVCSGCNNNMYLFDTYYYNKNYWCHVCGNRVLNEELYKRMQVTSS